MQMTTQTSQLPLLRACGSMRRHLPVLLLTSVKRLPMLPALLRKIRNMRRSSNRSYRCPHLWSFLRKTLTRC